MGFLQSFQGSARTMSEVGPDFLLLRPFQFLIHYHQVFQRYTVKAYW